MSIKNRKPPKDNYRRVRSTGKNICGNLTSRMGTTVQFESLLEKGFLLRLDRNKKVKIYLSQPDKYTVRLKGKPYSYIPDFLVVYIDGTTELYEITIRKREESQQSQRRQEIAASLCNEKNWKYLVHTEETLPKGAELANLQALFCYRPLVYHDEQLTRVIREYLYQHSPISIFSLMNYLTKQANCSESRAVQTICHLLWHGYICFNFNQTLFVNGSLDLSTLLSLNGE